MRTVTEKEILLKKISTLQFAIADLHLFLDTHPRDEATLEKIEKYRRMLEPLLIEYESKYGPLRKHTSSKGFHKWISEPWPWENEVDE